MIKLSENLKITLLVSHEHRDDLVATLKEKMKLAEIIIESQDATSLPPHFRQPTEGYIPKP